MLRSVQSMTFLLLSVIAVLLLARSTIINTSATTIVQLQPNTVSSRDKVSDTDMARNASTISLSNYTDFRDARTRSGD